MIFLTKWMIYIILFHEKRIKTHAANMFAIEGETMLIGLVRFGI